VQLDDRTLHDLEITRRADRSSCVLDLLDRTGSRRARDQLEQRVREPLPDADAIVAGQEASRALHVMQSEVRRLLRMIEFDETDRYLASRWEASRARSAILRAAEAAWVKLRYRPFARHVVQGGRNVRRLMAAAGELARALERSASLHLRDRGAAIRAMLGGAEMIRLRDIRNERWYRGGGLHFDQLARGPARETLLQLLDAAAAIDVLLSLAEATHALGWTYPEVGGPLEIIDCWHPLLPDAARNSLVLNAATRVVLITGPNMAGKTTYLKSVGVCVYLAHLGCGVPAASMRFVPVSAIMAGVEISERVASGESFFFAEVRRIKALATLLQPGQPIVGMIDEPFRGTNIRDATDATTLLFRRLASHPAGVVLVTTHLVEVAATLRDLSAVRLVCFEGAPAVDGIVFDHRMREGLSDQRLGMALLRQEGVAALLESW
jgi:DNA mismatch repair protein MutS